MTMTNKAFKSDKICLILDHFPHVFLSFSLFERTSVASNRICTVGCSWQAITPPDSLSVSHAMFPSQPWGPALQWHPCEAGYTSNVTPRIHAAGLQR